MADALYYCTRNNNTCSKKETCKRYIEANGNSNATLFKNACIENNNYVLYIESEKENSEENGSK